MRTIGRYRVVSVLGRGAFASVFLGHDDELQVPVAIKLLADNWATDAEVSERFLAEARLLRRIADPRVVRVYDVGTATVDHGPPQPYFVMDHVAGGTLADRAGKASPAEVLQLCAESARAVQVLHDWGVVHRDVKPSNLLVDESRARRRVVVSDLGTAKALADATGITMTMGTPAYMAPEQVFSPDGFDHRVDVYALGVLTYVMLTGEPPYPIRSVADLVSDVPLPEPPPVADLVGMPADLDDLLRSAVSVDRAERPATAADLAARLAAIGRVRRAGSTAVQNAGEQTIVRPAIVLPGAVALSGSAAGPATMPRHDEQAGPADVSSTQDGMATAEQIGLTTVGAERLAGPRVPIPLVALTALLVCALAAVITWLALP